jgi:hypothetical protein
LKTSASEGEASQHPHDFGAEQVEDVLRQGEHDLSPLVLDPEPAGLLLLELRGDQLGDLFVAHARDVGVRVQRGLDVVVEVHVRQLRLRLLDVQAGQGAGVPQDLLCS